MKFNKEKETQRQAEILELKISLNETKMQQRTSVQQTKQNRIGNRNFKITQSEENKGKRMKVKKAYAILRSTAKLNFQKKEKKREKGRKFI